MELDEVVNDGCDENKYSRAKGSPDNMQFRSDVDSLFKAIDVNEIENFRRLLDECVMCNALETLHNGSYTLLQYICIKDYQQEFAEELMKRQVSPNAIGPEEPSPPFLLAAEYGRHHILKMLLDHKDTDTGVIDIRRRKETALHKVVLMEHGVHECRNYMQCLDMLLSWIDINEDSNSMGLNINAVDDSGNTALHVAAARLKQGGEIEEEIVMKLLRAGSDIAIQNKEQEPAFRRIPAELLETFLDECVTTNEKAHFEKDFKITFGYKFLVPSRARPGCVSEQFNRFVEEPLLMISNSEEHRRLFKHPILASCIFLMWFRIRWIFFVNFAIYALYVIFMTVYILEIIEEGPKVKKPVCCSSPVMPLFFFLFCIKEFTHTFLSLGKYMKIPINRPKILIMFLSGCLLWIDVGKHETSQIATLTILLMWIELALILGQHPRFITYIIMFKTVCINFFFFLAIYSMFVLAFAFSFFILFHDEDLKNKASSPDSFDYFINPWMTLIKTTLMMLGEFELSSIPFEASPFLGYTVFSAFILLISVVLINLLNGLAVSDTHDIMEKAELVGYVSQIEVFSQMEAMMLDIPRLIHLCNGCFFYKGQLCLVKKLGAWGKTVDLGFCGWTHVFWKWKKVEVMVNQGGIVKHCACMGCMPMCMNIMMDERVIKRAVSITSIKRKTRTIDDIWKKIDNIENLMKKTLVPHKKLNERKLEAVVICHCNTTM